MIVLNERVPTSLEGLPTLNPQDKDSEWINLRGQPTANIFNPHMEAVLKRVVLERSMLFEDRTIVEVHDRGLSWTVFYEGEHIRLPGPFIDVDKAIGIEPRTGQTIRLYQDNPRSSLPSKLLGVALGDKALLFE